jgi:RNA polymerase sigma-70 factor (ECF subfamily)
MAEPALTLVRAPDDLRLASRCVDGDRSAQRELFDRERRRVHATLYRILGSNAHIDDLIQEVFIGVFRSLKLFRGEASLATWIDRCTVRAAFAYLSKRPPRSLELVRDIAAEQPSPEQRALAREAARRLYAELDQMDPKQRVAFTLHVIDGRPLQEVAALMEASLVATKTRVWRARRDLERRARRDPVLSSFVVTTASLEEEGA